MKRRKKGHAARLLLGLLVLALAIVAGVLLWKKHEYAASQEFYNSLRGAVKCGGKPV